MWNSPIPEKRWTGFRRQHRATEAFSSQLNFETAALNELENGLSEHELLTLGRLLKRGVKTELEVFVRTHGPNPLFDPATELDALVGVAKADAVFLKEPASSDARRAILEGEAVHVLFQAGEASRFREGPFYSLNFFDVTRTLLATLPKSNEGPGLLQEMKSLYSEIESEIPRHPPELNAFLVEGMLGTTQLAMIRAALRRLVAEQIQEGEIVPRQAQEAYKRALQNQKLLFFVSRRGDVNVQHDKALREVYGFYGFDPRNIVTIEQELIKGVTADEEGRLSLLETEWAADAAGHLYALIQSARQGDFTTYTESGRPIKPMELDALGYLESRGGKYLNIIRINDMDRHTVEIINAKALSHALGLFSKGYVNVIETVANPRGQKGGTGSTFGDPEIHVLTETHENSFPALSRPFETAMKKYLEENDGRHPAYNAMRQWAMLSATRQALKAFGGRIIFVPRQKAVEGVLASYLGVDMPMGDLSLLYTNYPSRMFQFIGPEGRELLIHDVKEKENLPIALRTILEQLKDPSIQAAVLELMRKDWVPLSEQEAAAPSFYRAPTPEFVSQSSLA